MRKILLVGTAAALLALSVQVEAQSVANGSRRLSNAAGLSAAGSGLVVVGSVESLAASGKLIIEGIEQVGNVARISVKGASDASRAVIEVGADVVGKASLVAGMSLTAVAESGGLAITQSGKLIAFIPNELGRAMVKQSRRGSGD